MTSPFDPVQIGPISLSNRFVKSGANEAMSREGVPTKAMVKHHADLAAGGTALTTMAYCAVSKDGRTLPDQIWMREEIIDDLKAVTDAVHANGGKISAQITHAGSFVTSLKVGTTLSSSTGINKAGLMKGNKWQKAMDQSDMERVKNDFAKAALLAEKAGFDGVELHMGHGYLLNQFISPLSNKRKDEFGGTTEKRIRFPVEVLSAVKEAVGERLAVIAKINVSDGVKGGSTPDDAIILAKALEQAGADMLVLSGGRNIESTWFMFGSPINMEQMLKMITSPINRFFFKLSALSVPKGLEFKEMYLREYSLKIRAAVKVPLAYLGGVTSIDNAQKAMDDGFECIAMARALIHDTGLVNKLKSGEVSKSGCTACNKCVAYIYHPGGTWCVENPANDLEINQIPASSKTA